MRNETSKSNYYNTVPRGPVLMPSLPCNLGHILNCLDCGNPDTHLEIPESSMFCLSVSPTVFMIST